MHSVTVYVLLLIVPLAFVLGNEERTFDFFEQYDFIVVGSGASGSVVAARLAEETTQRILLLEGGAKGSGQRDVGGDDYVATYFKTDPVTGQQVRDVPLTRYDVPLMADSIRLAPQELNNMWNIIPNGPFFAQAKVIGGNQATNGLLWSVPQKVDFDNWNLPGYTSATMWPIMKRIENATETGIVNPTDRGYSGKTNIKFSSFIQTEALRFREATVAAGYPLGLDQDDGTLEVGTYLAQNNIKDGIRQSTSISYLAPLLKANKWNLSFRTSAVVTRVLFDLFNNAIGVEYYDEVKKGYKQVRALKEVIIAAGDLQTAKILFNSGIGPRSVLQAFGKPLRVVNDLIGQKIRNHQRVSMQYTDATLINANIFNYPAASIQYARTKDGLIEGSKGLMFLNYNSGYGGNQYPDLQAIPGLLAGLTPTNPYTQGFAVTVALAHNAYANGTLNLTSSNPLDATVFTPNLFAVQSDAERVALGILEARRIMQFWNGSAVETAPGPDYDTVAELIPWIRRVAGSTCHYYGSAPMGTDPSLPTDPNMMVRGVQKLRLVGPAIIPNMVYPGMQPLAVALGEKATDLIKAKYGWP
jgi:choline dehydrogenase-like flavoprotein